MLRTTLLLAVLSISVHAAQAQQRRPLDLPRLDIKRDIAYAGTDNPRQRLDLFLPKQRASDDPLPVIAFIHGGGWRNGDKRTGGGRLARYVATGKYAGVSIGYRLSGEAQWPGQIHDCKAAIRWIKANAAANNLDAEKIAVWGTSAGGHLVSCLGTIHDDEPLEGKLGPHTDRSSRVRCVVNFYGPTNFLTMNDYQSRIDHDAENSPESLLIGGAIQEHKERTRTACPLFYVTKDDAPHLLVHGTDDQLVPYPQSVEFDKALRQSGVPSLLIKMDGGGHGFSSEELDRRMQQFFALHLRGEQVEISAEPIKTAPRRR